MAHKKSQLIDPLWGKNVAIADVNFVFTADLCIAGFAQNSAADALLFPCLAFEEVTDPNLVAVRKVVERAKRRK